jgi:glycosyltransferase involved in cell wall biosynthesis
VSQSTILYIHNSPMSFVRIDRDLLAQEWTVHEWYQRNRLINPLKLWRAVRKRDLVFAWFASWHSFWPLLCARLLGKPSILVTGGYDTAALPEADYGHQRGGPKQWFARGAMRLASSLVTNSYYCRDEAIQNANADPEKITVIHHGLDPEDFSLPEESKESLVVTVGNVVATNRIRKGMEPFVRAAHYLPDVPFVLIGRWGDETVRELKEIAPPNVTFTGYVSDEILGDYLRRAKVYVQASAHEGFGLSVAEAMLSGCIPIVTRVGALPEVVGDTGVYIESTGPEVVADGIRRALALDEDWPVKARSRIVRRFPLAGREKKLVALIERTL